jgi:hypothetical protein
VYLRSGVYHSAGETGRAVLRHELAHVGQFEKKALTYNKDTEALEREAVAAEGRDGRSAQEKNIVEVRVRGHTFRVRRDELPLVKRLCVKRVREWLSLQKETLNGAEYRRILGNVTRL